VLDAAAIARRPSPRLPVMRLGHAVALLLTAAFALTNWPSGTHDTFQNLGVKKLSLVMAPAARGAATVAYQRAFEVHGDDERAVPMTFLWVYLPGMATIDHVGQPELPIGQRIACRRCKGSGAVYYARIPAEIIGGKRIQCPECDGVGSLDLADQLFRYDVVSREKKRRINRRKSAGQQLELP
jgi:hypothetical protein